MDITEYSPVDENIGEEPKAPEDTTTTEQEGVVPYPVINTVDSGGEIMAKKFRKKPLVISAMQFNNDSLGYSVLHWINEGQFKLSKGFAEWRGDKLFIPTLEGIMEANIGDWIIKGVNGEFYPCKSDVFEKTYEDA